MSNEEARSRDRWLERAAGVSILLAGAFLLGALLGVRHGEVLREGWREVRGAPPLALPGPGPDNRELTPAEMLEALRAEVARLEQRESALKREVREAGVALNLLRARGPRAEAACHEQMDRKQAAQEELERVRKEKAEVERLAGELRQALREDGRARAQKGLDHELEVQVRAWLVRRELLGQGR